MLPGVCVPEEFHAQGGAGIREPVDVSDLMEDVTLARLQEIFRKIIRRQEDKIDPIRSRFGEDTAGSGESSEKMVNVGGICRKHRHFSFRKLLEGQPGKAADDCHVPCHTGADEDRCDPGQPGRAF